MLMLLASVGCVVLIPLFLIILSSFQISPMGQPVAYGIQGWSEAFSDPSVISALWNTFSLAIVRQIIATVIGILVVWLIVRTDMPLRNEFELMFWISYFLPTLPITLGWILLLDDQHGILNRWLQELPFVHGPLFNVYSFWGIVWVHLSATTIGVKVLLLGPAFRNLDAALEEASHACGAGAIRTLARIIVPVLAPAILVSVVLSIIRSLEAFEIELLLGVPIGLHVYSTKIYDFITYEPPQMAPATALSTVFLLVLFMLVTFQRLYTGRRVYSTVRGQGFSTHLTKLGRARYLACACVGLLAITVTIVPAGALVIGTFMTQFGYFDIPQPWTVDNWRSVLNDPMFIKSATNTLLLGTVAAAAGVILYALTAYVIVRTRFFGRAILDILTWIPWAIPGIILSLGLLWTVFATRIAVSLYGSIYLLIMAMVIKGIPLGVQMFRASLRQLGAELEEASWASGATWSQTYSRIVIPLLFPTVVVVSILVFVSAVRDIGTVVLLSSSRSQTLALLALNYSVAADYERGTVVALIMVVIVVLATLLLRLVSGKLGILRD